MADDKQKVQADGSGTPARGREVEGQLASESDKPDPARRDEASEVEAKDRHDFKGGQSNQAYYGKGQLGETKVGETENAPSTEE